MNRKPTAKYRLDKSVFKASTAEEAGNQYGYWKDKSMKERLEAAFYLIQQVYGTSNSTRLDRTVFSKRKI